MIVESLAVERTNCRVEDAPAEVQRFRGALFRQLRFGSSALTPCVKRPLKLIQAEMIRVASYRIPAIPSGLPGTWLLHETESQLRSMQDSPDMKKNNPCQCFGGFL